MAHDLNGSVNQSLFFSTFLKRISILLILLPFTKNSLFSIEDKFISFSLRSKIFKALRDEFGIIGYNKKLIFLTISKVV